MGAGGGAGTGVAGGGGDTCTRQQTLASHIMQAAACEPKGQGAWWGGSPPQAAGAQPA